MSGKTKRRGRSGKHCFTKTQRRKILKNAGGCCEVCGVELNMITLSCHHIVYVSRGGPTTVDNGMALCRTCHTKVHQGYSVMFLHEMYSTEYEVDWFKKQIRIRY